MEEKIKHCLELQDQLNRKINENWKNVRKKEDFYRAIWLECAEAVESLPWKWWKKVEPDIENLEIELADIFHFVLSLLLLEKKPDLTYLYKGLNEDFTQLLDIEGDYINHYLAQVYTKDKDLYQEYIFLFERIAEKALRQHLNGVLFFFGLLTRKLMDFDRLYLLYVGKNILNHIRQEMGYKSGEYKKLINGLEDNKYLVKVIKEVNSIENLEEKLRNTFKNLGE
ncbi:MAG: dUTP diphosphatase [Sulfurihydrogenibium sp.]|uniref:dUTP diphosphatase n=1 Tax=Sulfurihydrogenibium sp. TaxID=2053621 RepID=UPI000CB62D13|nr:MAG: dUTPase [Sulfurihydrogenibium sp.]